MAIPTIRRCWQRSTQSSRPSQASPVCDSRSKSSPPGTTMITAVTMRAGSIPAKRHLENCCWIFLASRQAVSGARDQMESTLLTFMENQVKRCRLFCWTCAGTGAQLLASRIRSASKSALPKIVALTTYHCLPRQSFWVSGNGHGWNSSCRSKPMCELSEAASNYWLNLRAGKPGPISLKSASVSSSCWSATKLSPLSLSPVMCIGPSSVG